MTGCASLFGVFYALLVAGHLLPLNSVAEWRRKWRLNCLPKLSDNGDWFFRPKFGKMAPGLALNSWLVASNVGGGAESVCECVRVVVGLLDCLKKMLDVRNHVQRRNGLPGSPNTMRIFSMQLPFVVGFSLRRRFRFVDEMTRTRLSNDQPQSKELFVHFALPSNGWKFRFERIN
jgi:hypothetical protein